MSPELALVKLLALELAGKIDPALGKTLTAGLQALKEKQIRETKNGAH